MVLSTNADSNWLADPNSGQILAYPIRATASRLVSTSAATVLTRPGTASFHPQIFSLVSLPLDQFPIY